MGWAFSLPGLPQHPLASQPAPCSSHSGARSCSLPWAGHCPGWGSRGEGSSLTLPQLPPLPAPLVRSGELPLALGSSWRSPSCPSEGLGWLGTARGTIPPPPSPVINTRCYFGASLRKKPTLLIKHIAQTTRFCHFGDKLFLQGTLSLSAALPQQGDGLWVLGSHSPSLQGWSLPRGQRGPSPPELHKPQPALPVSLCPNSDMQRRHAVTEPEDILAPGPSCWCQLPHLTGFCSRIFIFLYSIMNFALVLYSIVFFELLFVTLTHAHM